MIRWVATYLATIPPVFVDGFLYVWIAMLTALQGGFGSDDAAKYMSPELLFWLKCIIIPSISAAAVSLKMYRSTQFAEHQIEKKKNGTGNTTVFVKQ